MTGVMAVGCAAPAKPSALAATADWEVDSTVGVQLTLYPSCSASTADSLLQLSSQQQQAAEEECMVLLKAQSRPRQIWMDFPAQWRIQDVRHWLLQESTETDDVTLRWASGLHFQKQEEGMSLQRLCSARRATHLSWTVHLRLRGGKGGFGANLRSAGGRMANKNANEPQNISACRDLSGRRLRTVNEATQYSRISSPLPLVHMLKAT